MLNVMAPPPPRPPRLTVLALWWRRLRCVLGHAHRWVSVPGFQQLKECRRCHSLESHEDVRT